jgi:tetrahydromethanopterin S-methyltransferase subunit E
MLKHNRDALGFLLKHLIYGSFGGFLFGVLLLWFDVAGLATMIFASPEWPLFLLLLFFGLFVTFGSIGMGVGVMGLGEERD